MNYVAAASVYLLAMILAVLIVKAFKVQNPAVALLIGIPLGIVASTIAIPLWILGSL